MPKINRDASKALHQSQTRANLVETYYDLFFRSVPAAVTWQHFTSRHRLNCRKQAIAKNYFKAQEKKNASELADVERLVVQGA